jgi:hypothetical protein
VFDWPNSHCRLAFIFFWSGLTLAALCQNKVPTSKQMRDNAILLTAEYAKWSGKRQIFPKGILIVLKEDFYY